VSRSGIYLAETQEEKEAVYRFRYEIYVTEMGRYGQAADHERKMLYEPEDETARISSAIRDGEVVATGRLSWGGDAPLTQHLIDHYMLEPFLAELPQEVLAVAERGMVKPELRGSELLQIGISACVLAPSQRMSIERYPRGSRSGAADRSLFLGNALCSRLLLGIEHSEGSHELLDVSPSLNTAELLLCFDDCSADPADDHRSALPPLPVPRVRRDSATFRTPPVGDGAAIVIED